MNCTQQYEDDLSQQTQYIITIVLYGILNEEILTSPIKSLNSQICTSCVIFSKVLWAHNMGCGRKREYHTNMNMGWNISQEVFQDAKCPDAIVWCWSIVICTRSRFIWLLQTHRTSEAELAYRGKLGIPEIISCMTMLSTSFTIVILCNLENQR